MALLESLTPVVGVIQVVFSECSGFNSPLLCLAVTLCFYFLNVLPFLLLSSASVPWFLKYTLCIISSLFYGGFPCGSGGKESTYNVGDLGSIPGLGRSSGEGKGHPLQYSGLKSDVTERLWLCFCGGWGVGGSLASALVSHLHLVKSKCLSPLALLQNNRLGGLNIKSLFSGGWDISRSRHRQIWCLLRACFLLPIWPAVFSLYYYMAEGLGELFEAFFIRQIISFMRAPCS